MVVINPLAVWAERLADRHARCPTHMGAGINGRVKHAEFSDFPFSGRSCRGGRHGRGISVERNPRQTVQAARRQVRRVKRSTGRLLIAGLGFSVAYFFDAAQGRARRKQIVGVIRRAHGSKVAVKAPHPAPDLPRIGRADLGPRATFQRVAAGIRASARV
jgi:hypothetical protein